MPAEGLFTAGEQTFRPDHKPFSDSIADMLEVRRGAGVGRLAALCTHSDCN